MTFIKVLLTFMYELPVALLTFFIGSMTAGDMGAGLVIAGFMCLTLAPFLYMIADECVSY